VFGGIWGPVSRNWQTREANPRSVTEAKDFEVGFVGILDSTDDEYTNLSYPKVQYNSCAKGPRVLRMALRSQLANVPISKRKVFLLNVGSSSAKWTQCGFCLALLGNFSDLRHWAICNLRGQMIGEKNQQGLVITNPILGSLSLGAWQFIFSIE
jgi:hypothetical protein